MYRPGNATPSSGSGWLIHSNPIPRRPRGSSSKIRTASATPVGHALTTGLPVLFDEVAGGLVRERARPALGEIVRIRAIQDFTPGEAISFIFLLRPIIRGELDSRQYDPAALDRGIDELAQFAVDLYVECRDRMSEIKVQEAKRRVFVLERMASREARVGS